MLNKINSRTHCQKATTLTQKSNNNLEQNHPKYYFRLNELKKDNSNNVSQIVSKYISQVYSQNKIKFQEIVNINNSILSKLRLQSKQKTMNYKESLNKYYDQHLQKEFASDKITNIINHYRLKYKIFKKNLISQNLIKNISKYMILQEIQSKSQKNKHQQLINLHLQIKRQIIRLQEIRVGSSFQKQNHFLSQMVVLAELIERFIKQLSIGLQEIQAKSIFIAIVFLTTDQIISSYCFRLIKNKLERGSQANYVNYVDYPQRVLLSKGQSQSLTTLPKQKIGNNPNKGQVVTIKNMFTSKEYQIHRQTIQNIRSISHNKLISLPKNRCSSANNTKKIDYKDQKIQRKKAHSWSKIKLICPHFQSRCLTLNPLKQLSKNGLKLKITKTYDQNHLCTNFQIERSNTLKIISNEQQRTKNIKII